MNDPNGSLSFSGKYHMFSTRVSGSAAHGGSTTTSYYDGSIAPAVALSASGVPAQLNVWTGKRISPDRLTTVQA